MHLCSVPFPPLTLLFVLFCLAPVLLLTPILPLPLFVPVPPALPGSALLLF